jgi:fibronectin type 3 domain-containing protein
VSDAENSPIEVSLSGVGVTPHPAQVSWTASTSAVIGYYVYRATEMDGPYERLTSTPVASSQYTDYDVVDGKTYFYLVASVDSNLVESMYSNQAWATIPVP